MLLEVLYVLKYDYDTDSYNTVSSRTDHSQTKSVLWEGDGSPIPMIERREKKFLTADHQKSTQYSRNHRNHRFEIIGLRIGGSNGLVLPLLEGTIAE